MKLERWALIAEIISAVAIVLSLIFVGFQVRQSSEETAANSRALEATIRESMLNADLSIIQSQLPFAQIQIHNLQGTDPANAEERSQQTSYFFMMTRTRENYWNQYSQGMLDKDTYVSYREPLLANLEVSDFNLAIWNTNNSTLVPGFVAEINEELRRRGRIPISE